MADAGEKYGLAYGLARVTPGTNVLAFSAAVAWFLRGWPGALAAVVAGTIPSTILVAWLSYGLPGAEGQPGRPGRHCGHARLGRGDDVRRGVELGPPGTATRTWLRALALAGRRHGSHCEPRPCAIYVLGLAAAAGLRVARRAGE